MDLIDHAYQEKCLRGSDINEHLPTLKKYAGVCDHVTEMGVRGLVSTYSFLAARPKALISIDIQAPPRFCTTYPTLVQVAQAAGTRFRFQLADTLVVEIEETDLLFIDTEHTYKQLKEELLRHAAKARKFILLHDTETFGYADMEPSKGKGLMPALHEFLAQNPQWSIIEHFENNNGLTVLGRQPLTEHTPTHSSQPQSDNTLKEPPRR